MCFLVVLNLTIYKFLFFVVVVFFLIMTNRRGNYIVLILKFWNYLEPFSGPNWNLSLKAIWQTWTSFEELLLEVQKLKFFLSFVFVNQKNTGKFSKFIVFLIFKSRSIQCSYIFFGKLSSSLFSFGCLILFWSSNISFSFFVFKTPKFGTINSANLANFAKILTA